MGRVLLILTAACLAATFMIINNSSFRYGTTTASPKAEEVKPKSEKERTARREKESRVRASTRSPIVKSQAANSSKSYGAPFETGAADEVEILRDGSHATVKGDQTPVYSINSKDSNIVKLLNKGDQVSTDLEVIDAKGRWTIVNKSDLFKPGFVQPENLQPAKSTKNREIKKVAR